ncbi:TPM domain-containing protein [Flavobacterium sp. RHBU_24]|uniref:TPM domain-containing protein n=1 Tax=Flavobacterium sp. RHBU_24 TaxID=3391185 RepID=UPI0039850336
MKAKYTFSLIIVMLLLVPLQGFAQFKIPDKPRLQTSVYDNANLLSATDEAALKEKLVQYSDSTSTQIVVATVDNLNGESASRVAPDWAQQWGIGQAKEDNGIFILVSRDDRDMYIATGYGVQGRLPAGTVGTIIRRYITPEFKTGDYYTGLDKGTDAIFLALNGKFKEERVTKDHDGGMAGLLPFIIFIIILVVVFLGRGTRGGNNRGGGGGSGLLGALILSSLGSSRGSSGGSWGGGSSGGGGFSGGFGGGGFSGGGAGGSW